MCPQKMENAQYASFYAFVKKFSKCDGISTVRRAGRQRNQCTGGFVDAISIIAICVHPNPVVGFDNL
jgi:hypothetical protein